MNYNKIVRIKTEHSYEMKILFDVLKESLSEINMTFIKDTDSEQKVEKKKKSEDENEENEDTNCEESEKQKQTTSKKNLGGIRIVALDDHQTLMIYVKLNSSNFVEYYTRFPNFNVGLDLRELHKFMKGVDKDSIMTISVDKDDEQKIEFHLQNIVKGIDTRYKQKLMDIDDNTKRIPQETEFEMLVLMDTQDFRKICSEMSQFSEYIEIICTSKEITFKCLGDQNELTKTFKSGENGGVKILCLKNEKKLLIVQAIYNLKHLQTFGKCVNLCNDMQLYLKNNYPLFIHYTVGNLGKMLIGLSPYDEKAIKPTNDYDDKNEKHFDKNIVSKKNNINYEENKNDKKTK